MNLFSLELFEKLSISLNLNLLPSCIKSFHTISLCSFGIQALPKNLHLPYSCHSKPTLQLTSYTQHSVCNFPSLTCIRNRQTFYILQLFPRKQSLPSIPSTTKDQCQNDKYPASTIMDLILKVLSQSLGQNMQSKVISIIYLM